MSEWKAYSQLCPPDGHAFLLQRLELGVWHSSPPRRTTRRTTRPGSTSTQPTSGTSWHRQSFQFQLASQSGRDNILKPFSLLFHWNNLQDTLDSSSHPLTGPGTGSGSHLGSNSGQSGQGSLGSHSSHDVNYMNIYQNTNHPHLYVRYVTVYELLLMFDDVCVSYPLRKLQRCLHLDLNWKKLPDIQRLLDNM